MSNPIGDPGHGHSPAAWTAVIIMLVAIAIGTFFLLLRPAHGWCGSSAALRRRRRARRLGHGQGRLRRRRREVRAERALTMLADLTAGAVQDAEARASERPLAAVEAAALAQPAARSTRSPRSHPPTASRSSPRSSARARRAAISPRIPDPAHQARLYEQGGASTISVLTEGRRFKGSLADLEAVKRRGRAAGAAQGLHRDRVSGARGTRRRRRPRPADRRGARAGRARAACTRSRSSSA